MNEGNKNTDASMMELLLALKQNIMRDLHSSDVAIVQDIKQDTIICSLLHNVDFKVSCVKLQSLTLQKNDIVLVIYTDNDFRVNLAKFKSNSALQDLKSDIFHSSNFGIITGLLFRQGGNENVTK